MHVSFKSALTRGGTGPALLHGSLDPHETAPKRHLDRLSHFCTAHSCVEHRYSDWQTDRHTDHTACDICSDRSNRPHLSTMRRRCGRI